jgi:hypothetical protein
MADKNEQQPNTLDACKNTDQRPSASDPDVPSTKKREQPIFIAVFFIH